MLFPVVDLPPLGWVLLPVAALIIGISKTAVPGASTLSIALFAAFLPAKESTASLLLLLITGDIFALISYRRHADWHTLVRLIPAVAVGLAAGAVFLALADNSLVRRAIGIILLAVIAYTVWRRYAPRRPGARSRAGLARSSYGALGGFTTMVANAGGPAMSMYFLSVGFEVKAFLGTAAWFFAVINLVKVPIMAGLGLFFPQVLTLSLLLIPAVIIGAIIGRWIASRINQRAFEGAIIVCTVLGAGYLVL